MRKLIAGPVGCSSMRARSKNALRALQIVHAKQDSRLEFRRFHIENAFGIFLSEGMQQRFRRGLVSCFMF